MSRPFHFKRFSVVQEKSAMKVGTDGVLLGAWCDIHTTDRTALDIGAGTGLISLMLAQRGEDNPLRVDAVEIDEPGADEARKNVASSPWRDKVTVINESLQDFAARTGRRYDIIVSNPPFFVDSLLPPDAARTSARHTVSLSYEELISAAAGLLNDSGRFCAVIPCDMKDAFVHRASGHGLVLRRTTSVIPKSGAVPKRALLEFVHERYAPQTPLYGELTIELSGRHDYSPEYKVLTADFYLKF